MSAIVAACNAGSGNGGTNTTGGQLATTTDESTNTTVAASDIKDNCDISTYAVCSYDPTTKTWTGIVKRTDYIEDGYINTEDEQLAVVNSGGSAKLFIGLNGVGGHAGTMGYINLKSAILSWDGTTLKTIHRDDNHKPRGDDWHIRGKNMLAYTYNDNGNPVDGLVIGSTNGSVRFYDPATQSWLELQGAGWRSDVSSMAVLPNQGTYPGLVVGLNNGWTFDYDYNGNKGSFTDLGRKTWRPITNIVDVSSQGAFYAGQNDGSINRYDYKNKQWESGVLAANGDNAVTEMVAYPAIDGIAVGLRNGKVKIYVSNSQWYDIDSSSSAVTAMTNFGVGGNSIVWSTQDGAMYTRSTSETSTNSTSHQIVGKNDWGGENHGNATAFINTENNNSFIAGLAWGAVQQWNGTFNSSGNANFTLLKPSGLSGRHYAVKSMIWYDNKLIVAFGLGRGDIVHKQATQYSRR